METGEYIILMIVGSIIVSSVILPPLVQIKQDITEFSLKVYHPISALFNSLISDPIVQIIFVTLAFELVIYLFWKCIYKLILIKRGIVYDRKLRKSRIENLLYVDLKFRERKDLLNLSNKYKNLHTEFPKHKEEFRIISKKIKNRLAEEEARENLNQIKGEEEEARQELERINHEIYLKELRDKEKREKIIERLDIGVKEVFKRDNLSSREREIAREEGYHAINEYCVLENKLVSVLVKPPMNHSPTHAFLVWSVKKLLKKFLKIEKIREHETRDADLTFVIKNKTYAIEIERGSLIRKKYQLREKIESLEDTYRDRWMILVSNKGLVKKYKEFGNVSTRKNLRKKIEKWVKNA